MKYLKEMIEFVQDWEDDESKLDRYDIMQYGDGKIESRLFLYKVQDGFYPGILAIDYPHNYKGEKLSKEKIREVVLKNSLINIYDPHNVFSVDYKNKEAGYGWKLIPINVVKSNLNINNI